MAKNSAVNLDITNNADGFDISGGTTARKLTTTGADITLTGSGTNVYTFPAATGTLISRDSTDTLANKTLTSPVINTGTFGTTILPTSNDGCAIGSGTVMFSDLFLASGAVINFNNGDVTLTHSENTITLGGGDLALGSNNLTMTGSIAATGSRVTKGWFTDIESTNMPTVGGSAILTSLTAPQFTTIELGHASDTTLARVSAGVVSIEGSNILTAATGLALAGGTMTGDIQLGETLIKLDATLSEDAKWSGISTSGTLGATIAVGDLIYLNADDSRWELVDANLSDGYDKQLGISLTAGNDGDAANILLYGKIRSAVFPAFTVGSALYMSETAGDVTHTQPTTANVCIRIVGFALTAEDLMFNPSNDYIVHT